MITTATGIKKAYDYFITTAYYADHDETACIGTRKGCTIKAKEVVKEGAVYAEVRGCIETRDGCTMEIVRQTFYA